MNAQHTQIDDSTSQIDFIGEAIKEMRMQTASAGTISRGGEWSFPSSDLEGPAGYFMLRGQATVTLDGRETKLLELGDLLIVTRAKSHRLIGIAQLQQTRLNNDEETGKTSFLYATIHAQIANDCPFGSTLPEYLLFRAGDRTESPYLDAQLQCLAWEAKSGEPASGLIQARLWEIVFMQAFRVHLAKTKTNHGWLAAICDQHLSKVLTAIHTFPERDWTVEQLAAEASMSRATFARRFVAALNDTPMHYLFKQRMRIAAALLREPDSSIATIAQRVGYASESAFSSAFHRRFEIWPGEYRRQVNAPSPGLM